MADQHRSTEHSERILETADQLTTLGHKARDLESVLDQTAPRETTDLTALAEHNQEIASALTIDSSQSRQSSLGTGGSAAVDTETDRGGD